MRKVDTDKYFVSADGFTKYFEIPELSKKNDIEGLAVLIKDKYHLLNKESK